MILSVPSKAYLEEQEEKLGKVTFTTHCSSLKPNPAARAQAPLKSAMKRSSSLKPALRSILKKSPVLGNISPSYASL